MDADADLDDRALVLRALDIPSISPALDLTGSSIAKRTGLPQGRVVEILDQLERCRPRVVRKVRGRQTGALWMRNPLVPACCG